MAGQNSLGNISMFEFISHFARHWLGEAYHSKICYNIWQESWVFQQVYLGMCTVLQLWICKGWDMWDCLFESEMIDWVELHVLTDWLSLEVCMLQFYQFLLIVWEPHFDSLFQLIMASGTDISPSQYMIVQTEFGSSDLLAVGYLCFSYIINLGVLGRSWLVVTRCKSQWSIG